MFSMNISEFVQSHETFFSVASTVVPWLISAVLGIIQIVTVIRRKMEKTALTKMKVSECTKDIIQKPIEKIIRVPYVPNENILKLIKILENQDVGWNVSHNNFKDYNLEFGSIVFSRTNGNITVSHNGTALKFKSKEPNLDNQLLSQAFSSRIIKETSRIAVLERRKAEEVINKAHQEVEMILKHI